MTVNIMAFGIAKEIVGGPVVTVPLEECMTVKDIKANLERNFPKLKQLNSLSIAINGQYVPPDAPVSEGDEIAIIPPVSGG